MSIHHEDDTWGPNQPPNKAIEELKRRVAAGEKPKALHFGTAAELHRAKTMAQKLAQLEAAIAAFKPVIERIKTEQKALRAKGLNLEYVSTYERYCENFPMMTADMILGLDVEDGDG